jgi:hypothetical protein
MHINTEDGFTFYSGEKRGAWFVSFHLPLHNGWCSRTGMEKGDGWRIAGGWEYYQLAILTGHVYTNKSRWYKLPTLFIPYKIAHLWRMRHKDYRNALKPGGVAEVQRLDK